MKHPAVSVTSGGKLAFDDSEAGWSGMRSDTSRVNRWADNSSTYRNAVLRGVGTSFEEAKSLFNLQLRLRRLTTVHVHVHVLLSAGASSLLILDGQLLGTRGLPEQ